MAHWRDWKFVQDLTQGTLDTLIYDPQRNMLTFPEGIRICWGPSKLGSEGAQDRVWWSYSDPATGDIWVAKSDKNFTYWEERQRLLFVPSGSTNPSVVFDNDGRYIVAVEFLPAGSEQKEIWLYEPPYSGAGIRRVAQGQYPVLAKDIHGEIFLFYQAVDGGQILYRKSSEAFVVEHVFETSDNELFPRGFRIHHTERSPYHDIYKHLMFYQVNGEVLPRYKMSRPIDFYTVGLDLYITDSRGRGISGVHVEIEGQSRVTNTNGLVTFYKLPYNTTVEIKLSHPFLGLGDTQHIFIPESARGTHIFASLFFTNPKIKENLRMQTGLTGIEWKGTELVEIPLREKLGLGVDLGIEWESMVVPTYFLVYADSFWKPKPNILEDFEDGEISSSLEFIQGSAYGWTITNDHAYSGSYSLRSDNKGKHGAANKAEITFKFQSPSGGGNVSFWYKVSSETNYDKFFVYLNGNPVINGISGNLGWAFWEGVAPPGENTITFTYSKDSSTNRYDDCVYIDDLSLPSSELVYTPVANATITLADQTAQTNQDGLARFQDLQANKLYEYEITHPDYSKVTKGQVLIPEGEFEFIPVKIYEEPWDGYALEEMKVHADLDVNWVAIDREYRQPKESVSVSVGLTSILWVEVTK